ncbi:MAG: CPBP family intramembrane metalloprotease [Clostridiales bacterium]|jgi:membrane protease YdiL (CAAX protease family)|nr:CPBP family intramembrane metalloprotease [Clostridiales bacterium]
MYKGFSRPRRFWRIIYPSLLFLLLSVIVSIAAGVAWGLKAAFGGTAGIEELISEMTGILLNNAMWIQLAYGIVSLAVFIPLWLKTRKRYTRYSGGRIDFAAALLTVGIALGANMLLDAAFTITDIAKYFPSYEDVARVLTSGSFPLRLLTIAVIAPAAEEFCFRGVTLNRMENMKKWSAVLISSALFGFVHLNPLQGLYAMAIGILLAFIFTRFKSMWYPVIAHVSFNAISVIKDEFMPDANLIALLAAGTAIFIGCGALLLRRGYPPEIRETSEHAVE